ncbi:scavenger receptor class F member 1-like [Haliotis rubra]|uniref:scavenger receptor class F member 1-like n=1 Tax=Haliotis rubra TaxID=36100 RepID=UPI001EE5B81B|nr:scavenger receptor class F member 1-like [Haliotis rubra]
MTVWLIMWTALMVMATEAVPCHYTHHCSDCDRETGDCHTECDTGYYDRQCNSTCSRNCRNNTCVLSEHGSGNCTEGCVPGYSGIGCNIPCDSPGGSCTACPGGCDGGYCQLGSSCVSGCVDSYYGTVCKAGTTVGLSVGLSGVSSIIFLVMCCKCCQRLRQNSVTNKTEMCNNVAEMGGATVQELEW